MSAPTSSANLGQNVLQATIAAFQSHKSLADRAVAQLSDEQLHIALDEHTNCVAVIMKHVAGNLLSRWTDFLTTDGEKPWRNRDQEFVDTFKDRQSVLDFWEQGWQRLFATLDELAADDLLKSVSIRGEPHSVPLAAARSLAHTSYHVGQIVLVSRVLADADWETLTIPRGESAGFNQKVWGQDNYRKRSGS